MKNDKALLLSIPKAAFEFLRNRFHNFFSFLCLIYNKRQKKEKSMNE